MKASKYELTVEYIDESECGRIDPLGGCYPEDCLRCRNAKVKLIREDGTVMRDDDKENVQHLMDKYFIKHYWRQNPYRFIEEYLGIKPSRFQKFIIRFLK